jgi:hypothetical protein
MQSLTSEEARPGAHLSCSRCGTQVRLDHQGGGRMECCDAPLHAAGSGGAPGTGTRARCAGCGNEVTVERDGGGRLECCNAEMVQED